MSKPVYVWVVEWRAFNGPNGRNTDCRRFFGTDKQAYAFIDQLRAAAQLMGVDVTPTTVTVEVE